MQCDGMQLRRQEVAPDKDVEPDGPSLMVNVDP